MEKEKQEKQKVESAKKVKKKKSKNKKTIKKVKTPKTTAKVDKAEDKKKTVKEEKKPDSLIKKITIKIPSSEIEKGIDELAEKYSSEMKLSGFRKGKVPTELMKNKFKDILKEESLNKITEEYVFKKIEEEKLRIASQPIIDNIDYKKGKDLTASVTIETLPDFEIPDLETIIAEIKEKDLELKEYDEKEQIDLLLTSRKRLVSVKDREIKEGDTVNFKFQSQVIRTKKMSPRIEETFTLDKGQLHYIDNLFNKLLGKKTGETINFEHKYPKDYPKKKWAGEKIKHIIEIIRIQEYFTPSLDDDTLKELGFKTKENLKKKLKEDYEAFSKEQTEQIKKNKKIEKLLEIVDFPLPQSLVQNEVQRIKQNPQELYLYPDEASIEKKAADNVKYYLIHSEIINKHKIEAVSDDYEAEYKAIAEQYKMPVKEIRKFYSSSEYKQSLKDKIIGDKVSKLLDEKIKIKEIK